MAITEMQVTEWLTELGSTADEVADTLRAAGIKGTSSAWKCPVAKWLQAKVTAAGGHSVSVGPTGASVWLDADRYAGQRVYVDTMPSPVRAFIRAFDREQASYADLREHRSDD
jgi:hypothetical protein